MVEFLPNGSLYVFLGVASILFSMMGLCFGYYKCKDARRRKFPLEVTKIPNKKSNFLKRRGERADDDEETGSAENQADKVKAEIDAKYTNQSVWTTTS